MFATMVEIAHIIDENVNINAHCTVKIHIERSNPKCLMIEIAQIKHRFQTKTVKKAPLAMRNTKGEQNGGFL
ncbi:hypothetical protein BXO88_06655 [Oribacterium sp. C9]|nr:hypothetical protein BXO88_06655 [Oribacterium sp. C9]